MEEQQEAVSKEEETPYLRQQREERDKREAHAKLAEEHADAIREIAEQAISVHRVSQHLVAHALEVGLLEEPTEDWRKRGAEYRLWYDFQKGSLRYRGWLGFTKNLVLQVLDKIEPGRAEFDTGEIYLNRD